MTPEKNTTESTLLLSDPRVGPHTARDMRAWSEKDMLRAIWRLADCEVLRLFADAAPDAGSTTYH